LLRTSSPQLLLPSPLHGTRLHSAARATRELPTRQSVITPVLVAVTAGSMCLGGSTS